MAELSIWDCIEGGPALPPESCRTLDRLDDERRRYLGWCVEREHARAASDVGAVVRAFEAVWPRYFDKWLLEQTTIVAGALSLFIASPALFSVLVQERDEVLVQSLN
jgi:hypothetical protein